MATQPDVVELERDRAAAGNPAIMLDTEAADIEVDKGEVVDVAAEADGHFSVADMALCSLFPSSSTPWSTRCG